MQKQSSKTNKNIPVENTVMATFCNLFCSTKKKCCKKYKKDKRCKDCPKK